jgi:hypothetical protein
MIFVGQRVQEAIDHLDRGRFALAVTPACLALDVTSQRFYGAGPSGPTLIRRFVQEHLWLIAFMGFPGLGSAAIRIPFSHPEAKPDAAGTVGLDDVICHVIRYSLIHVDDRSARITWTNARSLGLDPSGHLILNSNLIWGLIGAVVFSPANKNELIPDNYWLHIADFKMFISELWGRIDIAKRVVTLYTGASIP